jgi:hypothetical protein
MTGPVSGALFTRARRAQLVGVTLAGMFALGLVGAPRAAADTQFVQSVTDSSLPSGAVSADTWVETQTACDATDSCVAVGYYTDGSNNTQAMVMPITNGVPGSATEVTLPANQSTSSGDARLSYVSCESTASCTALGTYQTSAGLAPMVVQITNGVVAPALEIPAPSNPAGYVPYFSGISCLPAGPCEAAGDDADLSTANYLALVMPITNGLPGTPTMVTLPSNVTTSSPSSTLADVACQASSGSCTAVGEYVGSSGHDFPLTVEINNGVPAAGLEAPEPALYNGNPIAYENHVACPASGACQVLGVYYDGSDTEQLMATPVTDGQAGVASEVSPPGSPAAHNVHFLGFSCSSASLCEAVGYYYATQNTALLMTLNGSGPDPAQITPPAGTDLSAANQTQLNGVSCLPSGSCVAAGWFAPSSGEEAGMQVQTSASGSTGAGVALPAPSDADSASPSTQLEGIACASSVGSCAGAGSNVTAGGTSEPYVVSEQIPLSISTTSLPGMTSGAAYQTKLTAAGAWGAYSWSVSSGSLPAGLSLNPQSGVISGTPTAAGTANFTVKAIGTGVPAQTATQALSAAVAASGTTTTPAPKPSLRLLGGGGAVSHNRLGVKLVCAGAPCHGSLKLELTEVVTVRHGKKRVRKHITVVIGTASYSATVGQTETVNVAINAAGRRALTAAKHHRLSVTVAATISGGAGVSRHETIHAASKPKKR